MTAGQDHGRAAGCAYLRLSFPCHPKSEPQRDVLSAWSKEWHGVYICPCVTFFALGTNPRLSDRQSKMEVWCRCIWDASAGRVADR